MKRLKCLLIFKVCLFFLFFTNTVIWSATFTIYPGSLNVASSGGSFNIDVTSSPSGAAAFVFSQDSWITLGWFGSTRTPFTQIINVQQNNGFCPRTGTVLIGGTALIVTQESAAPPVTADGDVAPLGNRDGNVDVGDALVALRFALMLETLTQEDISHGDVAPLCANNQPNPDGKIDVGDALVILRKALGLISF